MDMCHICIQPAVGFRRFAQTQAEDTTNSTSLGSEVNWYPQCWFRFYLDEIWSYHVMKIPELFLGNIHEPFVFFAFKSQNFAIVGSYSLIMEV